MSIIEVRDNAPWMQDGACRGEDPELFFPEPGPNMLSSIAIAKGICYECPVRETCLEWAIETNQEYGVWGGLTRNERLALRRRARANLLSDPA